jgi:hypothetical protein
LIIYGFLISNAREGDLIYTSAQLLPFAAYNNRAFSPKWVHFFIQVNEIIYRTQHLWLVLISDYHENTNARCLNNSNLFIHAFLSSGLANRLVNVTTKANFLKHITVGKKRLKALSSVPN